jgi:hypothetical protein
MRLTDLLVRRNAAGSVAVDSRRPPTGRFGQVHHRTSGRPFPAQSSNAAGPGGGVPHRDITTGSQVQRPRHGGEGRGRPAGVTRVGPGCSVDNGSRSTRSQRVPGRPEGHRAPTRSDGQGPRISASGGRPVPLPGTTSQGPFAFPFFGFVRLLLLLLLLLRSQRPLPARTAVDRFDLLWHSPPWTRGRRTPLYGRFTTA